MRLLVKKILISLFIIIFPILNAEPVIQVETPGLLGNKLFAYCFAKVIAEKMEGWKVYSTPIWGFPNTYSSAHNKPSSKYSKQTFKNVNIKVESFDLNSVISNKKPRNINIHGFFNSYDYMKPYADLIRKDWLKIEPDLLLPKNHDSIVIHVRAEYPKHYYIPFEYYEKALSMASYDRVYICTDNPDHPFLKNFAPYDPIIVSTRNITKLLKDKISYAKITKLNMDDFFFIHSFDKIISGLSTYSWWAAFLSDAKEIYAPYNESFKRYKVEEGRYHYIPTPVGHEAFQMEAETEAT